MIQYVAFDVRLLIYFNIFIYILTWQGRYLDDEGGFPRVRLVYCTPEVLSPAVSSDVGNLTAHCDWDCVHALP